MQPFQTLLHTPVCRGLTEAECQAIFEISEETRFAKGVTVFRENDPGDAMFAVLEGHLEILKADPSGAPRQLAKVGDGGMLGEMSLLLGGSPRSATVVALSDVRLLKIPAGRFGRLLRGDNIAALKVVQNLAQLTARRLLLMNEKLVGLLDRSDKRKEELGEFQKILADWSF